MNLGKELVVNRPAGVVAAGTTAIVGDVQDMANAEEIEYYAVLSTATNGAVITLKVEEGATSSAFNDLPSAAAALTSTGTAAGGVLRSNVVKPRDRFVRPRVTRATQNASIGGVIAVIRGKKALPITQHAEALANAVAISPST